MEENLNQKGSITAVAIITAVVTALLVGGGVYIWQMGSKQTTNQGTQQQVVELQRQVSQLQKQVEMNNVVESKMVEQTVETNKIVGGEKVNKENSPTTNEGTSINSEMTDWKTYENAEYGYSIKYPKEWTLRVVSSSDNDIVPAKYISFTSPRVVNHKDDYFGLQVGIKYNTETNFRLSHRTGVGAREIDDGQIKLGKYTVKVDIGKDMLGGQLRPVDIIGKDSSIDTKHIALVEFSYFGIKFPGGENFDITKTDEYRTAQKILKTFKFNDN